MVLGITTSATSFLKVLVNLSPLGTLLTISFILTLLSTLAYKYLTDQKKLKEIKDETKKLQEEMKLLKNDASKMMEKQKEIMQKNMYVMRSSFKPLLYTFIPFLLIFILLKNVYEPLGKLVFGLSWIWIYVLSSFVFSILIRKLLKVH